MWVWDCRPWQNLRSQWHRQGLEGIVNFYYRRLKPECPDDYTDKAVAAGCWPPPEVSDNINTAEVGKLGLNPDEEAAIVAFLKALSDGYQP